MPGGGGSSELRGRRRECQVLEDLLASVRAGRSRVLVLRGEPGIGKTALLDYIAARAAGCRVARVAGDESEMELAFAGLHLICGPMLDHLDRIPPPQRDALAVAFGLSQGQPPDRLLIGLAALSLLAAVAEEKPLVCLIDDAQWLDQVSAFTLALVARRLLAEPVAMIFAAREGVDARALDGLPDMSIEGLPDADARDLLQHGVPMALDGAVVERIVAEAHGNPLALLELPRATNVAELAGGLGITATMSTPGRIEAAFARRIAQLPEATQRFLLVAAAEPVGDATTAWRAAASLGIPSDAAVPAIDDALVQITGRVVFRHPLVRSVAYRRASASERRDAHRALADASVDADRRAWHRGEAAGGPDEDIARELESAAVRARARGGLASAAAFLERSVALTTEPARRVTRSVAAAASHLEAGGLDAVDALLASVEAGSLDPRSRAQVELMRCRLAFMAGDSGAMPKLLLDVARRVEPHDARLSRETYLQALNSASYAGRFAVDVDVSAVARAVRLGPPPPDPPRGPDLLLDGLVQLVSAGVGQAAPALRRATDVFRAGETTVAEDLRWLGLACVTASSRWDHDGWFALASRGVDVTRRAGALTILPVSLNNLATLRLCEGELDAAGALIAEAEVLNEMTGSEFAPFARALHAALRGREPDASEVIAKTVEEAMAASRGYVARYATWAAATLHNGLARYDRALAAAHDALAHPTGWSGDLHLHELVEAAARSGQRSTASEAIERLAATTQVIATDWPLGVEARSRALVSERSSAEELYREAIERLGRTPIRLELARAHLLYGEWLRRENRRVDARAHLRTAHEFFVAAGAEAFAGRAARELAATGETVRKRTVESRDGLTAQEAQVAHLAAEGRTNPEIGAALFISARTVEWHLRKIYPKLGITSRRQLRHSLAQRRRVDVPA